MFGLEDMRVLVTASTRGIGFGVAHVLLREGAYVMIDGRGRESVFDALRRLGGVKAYGVVADLTRREDVERLVEEAAEHMGGLDALVYVTGPPRPGCFTEIGIRVNAVMPGYIDTDRVRQLAERRAREKNISIEDAYREIAAAVPMGRMGKPEEIGYVVAFLLSPYASYVTGASIPVDGGLLSSVF